MEEKALVFEWDARKATTNQRKHGISFDEASSVFEDTLAMIFDDLAHSHDERRELIVGRSILGRLLMVGFTERASGCIRLISARSATRAEQRDYEEGTTS